MIDVQALRTQFPSLRTNEAKPSVFFDNPAGTQVPQRVIDAVADYYRTANANSGGYFSTSRKTDELTAEARNIVADFLNASRSDEIVFGANMTTLNFALSRAIAKTLSKGDEIVLTRMDHDANVAPWMRIADDANLIVRWVDFDPETGTLSMDTLRSALNENTKIVATVHASNALGTVNPIAEIAALAHEVGAYHIVDAVQSAPHVPLDVQAIGCDFLLCSAYKFFGPHVGVMWGRYDLLAALPAYKVRPSKDKPPYRWETGTPSYETIHATAAALEYIQHIGEQYGQDFAGYFPSMSGRRLAIHTGMVAAGQYERELVTHLIEQLETVPGVRVYGITDPVDFDNRVPTVIFSMQQATPDAIAEYLAQRGIYVWSGDYYAVEVMRRLDRESEGLVRVGLAHYNTHEEIDRLHVALRQLADA